MFNKIYYLNIGDNQYLNSLLSAAAGQTISWIKIDPVALEKNLALTSPSDASTVATMQALEDPAFQAHARWAGVDPEIGDEARDA